MAGNINNIVEELFARQKQNKDTDDKQSMADSVELTPKASKPVRVISRLSPMFSPMREFSIKMNSKFICLHIYFTSKNITNLYIIKEKHVSQFRSHYLLE